MALKEGENRCLGGGLHHRNACLCSGRSSGTWMRLVSILSSSAAHFVGAKWSGPFLGISSFDYFQRKH